MQPATDTVKTRHYRAIWISDVHLGTAGCRADHLLDFQAQRIGPSLSGGRYR
jgi:hypothetical protein